MINHIKNSINVIKMIIILLRCRVMNKSLILNIISTIFPIYKQLDKQPIQKRIIFALQKLGPIFIKFGQILSMRPDIVGTNIALELSLLCDKMDPYPYEQAKETIEQAFKKPIQEIFIEFEKKAVAAASISQVHKAKTICGNIVAVKVLRPNIKKIFINELNLLQWLATICNAFIPKIKRLKLTEVINMLIENTKLELDLRIEAANASELKENTINDKILYIPEVFWQYTTQQVLTIEWIDGIPLEKVTENTEEIVKNLAMIFFNQAYKNGFFHADMHSGNILFDTKNKNIVAIDFGIMGRLDLKTRIYVTEILRGFLKRDYEHVANIHFEAGYVDPKYTNFVSACRAIGEPIIGKSLSNISIAKLLSQLFKVTADFNMETQIQLLLLQKSTILLEGMCGKINNNTNIWQIAEPWIEEWVISNIGIKAKIKKQTNKTITALNMLPDIIIKLNNTLDSISKKYNNKINYNDKITKLYKYSTIILLLIISILISIIKL